MRGSVRPAAVAATLAVLVTLGGCRQRETPGGTATTRSSAGDLADSCAGDSLRPATAAPAPGLWMYENSFGRHVAAMIGPQQPDARTLVVRRAVETVEVSAAGDTMRYHAAAVTVALELLPPLGPATVGAARPDSATGVQPAAIYAVSPLVRLAAYEPCATSVRGPRIRYLRRDAAGRIITDVLLHRASEQ